MSHPRCGDVRGSIGLSLKKVPSLVRFYWADAFVSNSTSGDFRDSIGLSLTRKNRFGSERERSSTLPLYLPVHGALPVIFQGNTQGHLS